MTNHFHNKICLLLIVAITLLPVQLAFARSFDGMAGGGDMTQTMQNKTVFQTTASNCDTDIAAPVNSEHTSHECNDCDSCSHCVAGISGLSDAHQQIETGLLASPHRHTYSITQYPDLKPPRLS